MKIIYQYQNNKMKIIQMDLVVLFILSKIIIFLKNMFYKYLFRTKPLVPERDSSLYECFSSSQSQQIYNTFRPLIRGSPSTISVPNLSSITNHRHNSNSSSNEADEESSLSSLNSNNVLPIIPILIEEISLSNMSTFKTINSNILPSKPSEIKRRSNNRKQIYATLNSNNNNNTSSIIIENETSSPPPPPPPPFPVNLDLKNKNENEILLKSDLQSQIEQAKTRLKKVNNESPTKSHPSRKFLITFLIC